MVTLRLSKEVFSNLILARAIDNDGVQSSDVIQNYVVSLSSGLPGRKEESSRLLILETVSISKVWWSQISIEIGSSKELFRPVYLAHFWVFILRMWDTIQGNIPKSIEGIIYSRIQFPMNIL